jgi:hypothetical protein
MTSGTGMTATPAFDLLAQGIYVKTRALSNAPRPPLQALGREIRLNFRPLPATSCRREYPSRRMKNGLAKCRKWILPPGDDIVTGMNKKSLRAILMLAAALFTLNLICFNYSQYAVLPALAAMLLLVALVGVGDALAAWLRIVPAGILDKAGLGLMAATAYFFLAGYLKILNRWAVLLFFAVSLSLAAWRSIVGRRQGDGWFGLAGFLSRPAGEYAAFLVPLIYAVLPPVFYDSLVYHLGIPNLYLQNGGFIATPQFVFANTFIYYEISLIPAVFLGDLVPRLFHFLLGTIFLLAVADEAAERWGIRGKARLLLALVSLPMTLFLLVTCMNDLAGAIFIFLAIRHFQRRNWKLAAAFWGFAVGIKYFNLLPFALFLAIAVKPWRKPELKKALLMALIVLLAVSPLVLKNFRFTGNPVFPFLSSVFPSPFWDEGRFQLLRNDVGRIVRSPNDFIKLPYSLSFFNHGYGGLVGPLFLVLLPFLLLAPVRQKTWLLWALLLLAIAPFMTANLRFVYIAFVLLAIFALQALETSGGRALKAIFHLLVAVNFALGFSMLEKFYKAHSAWDGELSPEEYKGSFFPAYPVFAFVNASTPARARVLVAGEARNYYLKRPYQVSSALDHGILKKYLSPSRTADEFFAAVGKAGFSYLLVNFSEQARMQGTYAQLSAEEYEKVTAFLRLRQPVFRAGPVCLYEVAPP